MKVKKGRQCAATVEAGEYVIDRWDGQRCRETSPMLLALCEECQEYYCLMMHWGKHQCDKQ